METEGKPVEREAQWLPRAGSTMASGPQEPVGAISLLEAAEWVLANWRWTVGTAVVLAALFFYRAARIPVTYTATAMFLPQAGGTTDAEGTIMGPLGALSGLLGSDNRSSFYADLAKSRSVLSEVAAVRYVVEDDRGRHEGTLIELWGLGGQGPAEGRQHAVDSLSGMIQVRVRDAGLVEVRARAAAPRLAEQIANHVIAAVDRWNREHRQTQATAERTFIQERVDSARQELTAAEEDLKRWLQGNASWQSSPALRFEYDRLSRGVQLKQAVYTTLAQNLEDVRLRAVRNTPLISVVDQAESNLEPDDRRIAFRGVIGFVIGAGLGIALAFLWRWMGLGDRFSLALPWADRRGSRSHR